jgi:hypothetical protein
MCYIVCAGGVQGGAGATPRENFFCLGKRVTYLGGFSTHGFFVDGFLFSFKELWLLTNPGHWVRVLNATGSYMYIVL